MSARTSPFSRWVHRGLGQGHGVPSSLRRAAGVAQTADPPAHRDLDGNGAGVYDRAIIEWWLGGAHAPVRERRCPVHILGKAKGAQTFCTPLACTSDSGLRLYDQRAELGTGVDHRAEATTGTDHRADAVAWEVANEEATSDARAMKPTANAVARNLRIIYPFCNGRPLSRNGSG